MTTDDTVVLKRKSYEHLIRTRDRALMQAKNQEESAEHARQWAREVIKEQRRLQDRLVEVVAAAASLGVSIQDINKALEGVDTPPTAW